MKILLDFSTYYFSFFKIILSEVFITLLGLSEVVFYDIQKISGEIASMTFYKLSEGIVDNFPVTFWKKYF